MITEQVCTILMIALRARLELTETFNMDCDSFVNGANGTSQKLENLPLRYGEYVCVVRIGKTATIQRRISFWVAGGRGKKNENAM